MEKKIKMGMIGGGRTAFIGAIHRAAAFMDNRIELVCGCFSSQAEISKASGRDYFLPDNRIYSTYEEMILKEAALPEDERMDFVSIVTPNHLHFEPAMMALDYGFSVVLDKPLTFSLEQAYLLKYKIESTGLLFALTHTYAGYPAVKEARMRVQRGDFGAVRKVYSEYIQGWLSQRVELNAGSNAGWRTDPQRSGKAGAIGDIGTHAWHLTEYITGLRVTELCADMKTFAQGRNLDDDGEALLHFNNGATGMLAATQIAAGEENALSIRIYGEKGGIEWHQEEPNTLLVKWGDGRPTEIVRVGNGYMSGIAQFNSRTPGGHPEGYIEAFANIYRNFALCLDALKNGKTPRQEWLDFPSIDDGVRGMQFIETMVQSSSDTSKWVKWIC